MPDDPDWTGCVIVAIPEAKDPIWEVSSERVPHTTLVWLGNQTLPPEQLRQVQEATEAVAHTVLQKMRVQVLGRTILGEDKADVLLLDLAPTEYVRRLLLQNPTIKALYDSVTQYPNYTPHITRGYPDTPAKEKHWERSLQGIVFDRIAVWDGDYTGEEYAL